VPLRKSTTGEPAASIPARYLHELDAAQDHAWTLLERGARDRHSAVHAPCIATASVDGPQVRTVTLRQADRARATLRFNVDARGGLARQLTADPRAMLHAYCPVERTQLRLRTLAVLHQGDPLAMQAWSAASPSARRCYLVPPPGSPSPTPSSGLPETLQRRAPTANESASGFQHFCVVELRVLAIEWLHLNAVDKRRARFVRTGDDKDSDDEGGGWSAQWLTP